MRTLLLTALVLLAPSLARAEWTAHVLAEREGGALDAEPVQARVDAPVILRIALVAPDGRILSDAPRARARSMRRTRPSAGPLPEGTRVKWLRVVPRLAHHDTPPPNAGIDEFSNAVLTGPDHGRWLGFDTLEYAEAPLTAELGAIDGARLVISRAPHDGRPDRPRGAGTMWIAARVTLADGTVIATAGAASVDRMGLTRDVMRVSFRTGDDSLGWLSTYFGVPTLFGSSGRGGDFQVDRYVGADCADVLVGGLRASGRDVPYVSVAGLSRLAAPVTSVLVLDGDRFVDEHGASVAFGSTVRAGDLVAIDYVEEGAARELPRAWDHVGALVRDEGVSGVLDVEDVLRHMGHRGLTDEPLRAQGRARLRVWRWRWR